jgi:hypothetical protein
MTGSLAATVAKAIKLFGILFSLISQSVLPGKCSEYKKSYNGIAHIRHLCRKTAALSCHRFLINYGVEKMNNI